MTEGRSVPVPVDSGTSGFQTEQSSTQALTPARPFSDHAIAAAIEGIAAANTRALGGEVGTALVAAATRQLVADNETLRAESRDIRLKYEAQRDLLEQHRTRSAVLEERLRADGRNRHLRNLAIAVGVGLVGVGINLARTQVDAYSIGAIAGGALLAVLGWFAGPKGDHR